MLAASDLYFDIGILTCYSHQDPSVWSSFISGTLDKKGFAECADNIDVSKKTSFRMRHTLMHFVKKNFEGRIIDETYVRDCHKGLIPEICELASRIKSLLKAGVERIIRKDEEKREERNHAQPGVRDDLRRQ